jgi:predicted metal-dependent peptidase
MQTLERKFKGTKIALMRSKEFAELSGVMMMGKTVLEEGFPSACTDGRNETYGVEFLTETLGFNKLYVGFVIIHENLHKAARHPTTYRPLYLLDARLANMACDFWINGKILAADPSGRLVAMPRDAEGNTIGLHDSKYDGWTVPKIFKDLQQQQEEGTLGSGGGGDNFDEHDWDSGAELSKEEAKQLEQDVKQALRQGQMAAKKIGAGGANSPLGINELLQSKVRWENEMAEFFRSSCAAKEVSTWRRPNRRFLHMGIIMPTLEGKSIREAVFALDASGSMFFENAMGRVVGEVKKIALTLNIDKVHVLYWDGVVGAHEEYDAQSFRNFEHETKPIGGGGTDPACVPAYLKEKGIDPEFVLMLTDGEVNNWGVWNVPVLWAIANQNKITAPVGKTINIQEAA